ncbi:hypothetical protein [Chryseobacterium geocarposphaerae]|uniref:Uncharacterized protein n=1 Tax=Chryseobacterium geocarposphaerae TaxID=1416776 RepID=A0A2M9CA38_9FLAO|nr:hypothetical protein [Chryseobacterium geocarposphaerae]PJJ67695.1 hypothetical protein CLV73_1714 [Chryseobacterium geocarposphaerae]
MKKLFLLILLYSFSILSSQAKNVHYTDFIDFTDNSGVKYNVMMVTDEHNDNDRRADATIRVLYTTEGNEHLIEFYSDCYAEKLKNGNTKISFIPVKNSKVQIIKGKDVSYSPDTFVYEVDPKTSKITGTQSDQNSTNLTPIIHRNASLQTQDRIDEIDRFYFRTEPMYSLLKDFYNKKLEVAEKPYYDVVGWFGSDGIAYQAFIISYLKEKGNLDSVVRVRYEKNGQINIVQFDTLSEVILQKDDTVSISIKPKNKTVKNIKGNSSYDPDSFSYTLDVNDEFISGKQYDDNSSADLSYIKVTNNKEFALKFYSENDEIYQKYFK